MRHVMGYSSIGCSCLTLPQGQNETQRVPEDERVQNFRGAEGPAPSMVLSNP